MLLLQLTSINDFYSMWQLEDIEILIKVYRYPKVLLNRHALSFLETSDLERSAFYFISPG